MHCGSGDLQVYEAGRSLVVGFGRREVICDISVAECRDAIAQRIQNTRCELVAFDLTGVELIPSGMIGLLSAVCEWDVKVCILNASQRIREMLVLARLASRVQIREANPQRAGAHVNQVAGASPAHRSCTRTRISRLRRHTAVRSMIVQPIGGIVAAFRALTR